MSKINDKSCATSNMASSWDNIDFHKAKNHIIKLQKRIALAYSKGQLDKVDTIQHTLIHSFYAKALAVKVVTSNKGKLTPGIDNKTYMTSDDKYRLMCMLSPRGYKHLPLKRIYIPKTNDALRPLSIPTMKDRAMQTLYKFALEPIAELTADKCSFGFRPERNARDAIVRCVDILSTRHDMVWALKADIKSCFDNISHKWILDNIPLDKKMLRKFIQCGYVDNGVFNETIKGVPQGGCLSTTICNMTLDGLERLLTDKVGDDVHMVRYADDIIILGVDKALLLQYVLPLINHFLAERGLELSVEKTKISHIDNGVTFLGYDVFRIGKNIFTSPAQKSIGSLLNNIGKILKGDFTFSNENISKELSQVLRGWFNYYYGVAIDYSLYGIEYDIMKLVNGNTKIAILLNKLFNKIFYL